ncbi:MAG: helicase-related protein, partial [Tannerellaceae bacterium]
SNFKSKESKVLIATDIAARGIDVDHLSHVINYDIPNIAETYVHRIGRTGRAGREGMAISFCDTEEVEYLHQIKKLTGAKININDSLNAASKIIMDAFKAMQLPKTMTKAEGTQSASRKKEQPWKRGKKDGKPQSSQGGKPQGQGGKSQSASGKPQQKRDDRRSSSASKSENRRPENRWGKSDRRSGSASGKPAHRGSQRERR